MARKTRGEQAMELALYATESLLNEYMETHQRTDADWNPASWVCPMVSNLLKDKGFSYSSTLPTMAPVAHRLAELIYDLDREPKLKQSGMILVAEVPESEVPMGDPILSLSRTFEKIGDLLVLIVGQTEASELTNEIYRDLLKAQTEARAAKKYAGREGEKGTDLAEKKGTDTDVTECLKVTNLQVYPVREPQGKLRAFVRCLLNDQIQLTGLKIYDGSQGLFVSYPNDPTHKGEDYRQLFYPITRPLRDEIEKAALAEYNLVMEAK